MIRILVAEDSASARAMLVKILAADPELRVVGQAKDGLEAVEMTQKLRPDIVTMDLQMPRLGGLEATQEIMVTAPTPIVIVTASTRIQDIAESLDSLHLGALDVMVKPAMPGTPSFAQEAHQLVTVIKAMAKVRVRRLTPPAPQQPPSSSEISFDPRRNMLVAVATAVGGPLALHRILSSLPAAFPWPILISHRITPGLTPGLTAWLAAATLLRVKVAEEGELLVGRSVYVAPDGQHLGVSKQGTVALSVAPPIGGFRPSANYLFGSVARTHGPSVLALMLTGEGSDGLEGARAVRQAGGRLIVQDEPSSMVFEMPCAAISAGLAHEVLPLESISRRLVELS